MEFTHSFSSICHTASTRNLNPEGLAEGKLET